MFVLRPLLPLLPFALGILAGEWSPTRPGVLCACAAGVVVLLLLLRGTRGGRSREVLRWVLLGVGLGLAGMIARRCEMDRIAAPLEGLPSWIDLRADDGAVVRLTGKALRDPERSERFLQMEVAAESIEDRGVRVPFRAKVILSWPAEGTPFAAAPPASAAPPERLAGRRFEASVTLRRPRNHGNPGAFDFAAHLERRGAVALAFLKSRRLMTLAVGEENRPSASIWIRRRLDGALLKLYGLADGSLSEEGAILRASLLGGRTGLPPQTERRLVGSGIYHVLAVSGLQVAVLAGAILWTLGWTPLPRRAAILIACGAVALYATAVAPSASIERAVLMAALAAASRLAHRRVDPLWLLGLSALLLLARRPSELCDPGFQLTFAATAGILFFAEPLASSMSARLGMSRLLATSLAAHAGAWPVVAWWFHRMVPYGIAANLLAVPLGSAIVILGLALLPADLLSEHALRCIGAAAGVCVRALMAVASVPVEGTPLSYRVVPPGALPLFVAFASLAALAGARRTGYRAIFVGLHAVGVLLTIVGPGAERVRCPARVDRLGEEPPSEGEAPVRARATSLEGTGAALAIDLIDVGQGDAILLHFPNGEKMLIDGGGLPNPGFDIGERVVVPDLERRGIRRIGRVLLTHSHADHGGGLRAVLRAIRVGELLTPDAPQGPLRDELEDLARAQGARVVRIRRGYVIHEGATVVDCLAPFPTLVEDENADSIVLRVHHADRSFLLTGDIGASVEGLLVASGIPPTDVLKVAHHGSATSTREPLLRALSPRVCAISVGSPGRFGHPARSVLDRLARSRVLVLTTRRDGAIRLSTCGSSLQAGSLLTKSPIPWPGPPLEPRR